MKRFIKMLSIYFIIIYLNININALSLETVRAQNVTKREANVGDLFPDWVPFKNKHGEDLGEFVQVPKSKPKKRLAPPMNFLLRAVAAPDDDYFEKGQGETDSDDYYEKKEWSDLYREANKDKKQNHTELSDIDGVVSIIVKKPTNVVVENFNKMRQSSEAAKEAKEKLLTEKIYTENQNHKTAPKNETQKQEKDHKYEDEIEYEDSNTEKRNSDIVEDDPSENVRTKTSILDSVDELKERHADEQRLINEKIKEEEIYKEEREREKIQAQLSNSEPDKYDDRPKSKKTLTPDYEEYEDKDSSTDEKYLFKSEKTKPTTAVPQRTKKYRLGKDKQIETGKLSVFKNPQLYIVYDDESEETTTTKAPKRKISKVGNKSRKFSAKYTSPSFNKDDNDRISLVPDDNNGKEGEPTLFFPKKRKNKKHKTKPTVPLAKDSSVAATVPDEVSKPVTAETVSDTSFATPSLSDTTVETSAADTLSTNTDQVTDVVAASSDASHKKKVENYDEERGGGKQFHSSHEEEHAEEGKKAYEGVHKESKSAKGHHEKENHLGKYDDKAGVDKHHEEESGHYGAHHHEEHGKKHAKYEESGKHSKGHNTKGSHDIHKKEEYEKKVEFFEEDGDSAEEEKHGGYNHEHSHDEGGHHKNSNYKAGSEAHVKGDSGYFTNGEALHVSKGHKQAGGHDGHSKHGQSHGEKMGRDSGKKWIYHHGYPAKTSNLVRVDRRADLYYHGPQYYG